MAESILMTLVGQQPGISTLALACVAWASWRVWRFTLVPLVWPQEPVCYPYLVPMPFFRNSYQVFEGAREYFGASRPVYTLVVAGQSLYVVTDPSDVQELHKYSSALSWESFVKQLFEWVGFSSSSVNILWKKPTPAQRTENPARHLPPIQMFEEYQRKQLLPGEKSSFIVQQMLDQIQRSLHWDAIFDSKDFVTDCRDTSLVEVDLLKWTTHTIVGTVTRAYWGDRLFEINTRMTQDYMQWERSAWKYIVQLPAFLSQDMLQARNSLIGSFQEYFDLPSSQRSGNNWWVSAAETEFRDAGLQAGDIGRAHMLAFWAVNGNMHKMSFWLLAHLLHDPELRRIVEQETLPAYQNRDAAREILRDKCPQLDAIWYEVLRMRMATSLMRTVSRDTRVGDSVLRKGHNVAVPYKELHNNEGIWGPNPGKFDPQRFLHNRKQLVNSPGFRPFGGGAHLCPGRFIAKEMVYSFITLALHGLRPELNTKKGCGYNAPRANEKRPAFGALPPLEEDRVFVWLHREPGSKASA